MTINKSVEDNLKDYLKNKNLEHAFLIRGPWGSGKTHFINHFIDQFDSKEQKLIRISLFGLKSLLEIDAQIFQTLHPILGSKPAKLVGNILKGAVSVGFRMDLYGDKKDETSTNFKLDKLDLSSLGIGVTSDIVLIFDDLERTEISIREILGYVNFMIEVTQVKVILIANEEALLENEDARKIYLKFKEKVIGKTFEVANDVEKIVISFLKGTSFKNSQNLKSLLIELHTISNCLNLRIIKQAIYDFQYVCKQIPSDRLEHKEFYTMFARIFLALSIEAKKGELTEPELRSKFPFQSSSSYKKYFQNNNLIFNGDIWSDMIFKNDLKKLNENISNLHYFKLDQKNEVPTWQKLWNFKELDDKTFEKLIQELEADFFQMIETEPSVYLNKVDLMVYFSIHSLSDRSIEEIKNTVFIHIEKHQDSKHWRREKLDSSGYYGTGRPYHCEKEKDFINLKNLIIERNNIAYEEESINISNQLILDRSATFLNAIEIGNTDDIAKLLLKQFQHQCFLNNISPKDFVNSLIRADHATIEKFKEIIYDRYTSNHSFNGKPYWTYYKDELVFWEKVEALTKNQLESLPKLKKHLFYLFCENTLPTFRSILSA